MRGGFVRIAGNTLRKRLILTAVRERRNRDWDREAGKVRAGASPFWFDVAEPV
jgi:hypothetical protein